MYVEDSIAAISTPIGEGGIGIVRISGPDSIRIASSLFCRKKGGGLLQSHRFYYGEIVDPATGAAVDEVLVVLMRAPNSFTREDVLEIHCHGGYLVTSKVLELVLRSGVRCAEPGEFTKRAFLNGRIDLVQAEAVIDVIRSKTEASLALAQHQREGLLSRILEEAREQITHALALIEAYIDFPEDDLGEERGAEISSRIDLARATISDLLAGYDEGKVLREGVAVLIAGKPNVGKSSLLNALLKEKRAIVTSVPGTTRDIIEEIVNIRGLPIRLLDTAGIRETEDLVEQEGIRLTLEKIELADLVLFMVDAARPFDESDQMIMGLLPGKNVIVVKNKIDLEPCLELPAMAADLPVVEISTKTAEGLEDLKTQIFDLFIRRQVLDSREFVAVSQSRHRDALVRADVALERFCSGFSSSLTLELLAVDLKDALDAVGEITGETSSDDILDLIFSRFCIGK